jgi:hypothetical protein
MNYFFGIQSGKLAADFEEGPGGPGPLGNNHPVTGNATITFGVWHHAAVTYDGRVWNLFLDGNLDATLDLGSSITPRFDSLQHAALATALTSTGAAAGYFAGMLDEVRIWNYARTQQEIQDNMNLQITSGTGLVGRWGLNEGTGTIAGNSIPGGVNGTLTNGPVWLPPDAQIAAFQEGVNGYSGTVDTYIKQASPSSSFGSETLVYWDTEETAGNANTQMFGLIRFDNIFGSGSGQIPYGSTIVSATLQYTVSNVTANPAANVNEVLADWTEVTSWNSFGGTAGVQPEDFGTLVTTAPASTLGTYTIDVTSSLAAWSAMPASNRGWIIRPSGTDGVQIRSSEYTTTAVERPRLSVTFLVGQAPNEPVPVQPSDGAIGVSTSPTLGVTVSDPDSTSLNVTFYGRQAAAEAGEDFTIVVLPDTQFYSESYPSTFTAQTNWIVNNAADRNIAFVTHVGDVVNVYNNTTQWANAVTSMSVLEGALPGYPEGIPYGIAMGNHDNNYGADSSYYNTNFGVSRFNGRTYYGGHYGSNNDNHYGLFSGSGLDFIIIHVAYDDVSLNTAILDWADGLLKTYSNRRAIVVYHDTVLTGNPGPFSTQGQAIYDALKDNPNLFLMLGGHTAGEGRRSDTFNGSTVYSLLSDYQSRSNGGSGWLRIMEFSPANNEIRVKTYSPTLDQWETDADSQFTLAYDMGGAGPYVNLGTVSGIASGGNASISWSGLGPGTPYEWFVGVSDGSVTTTSEAWSFTTEGVAPTCYTLTLGHTGQGSNPVASPANSAGCSAGRYVAGEVINLSSAVPSSGYEIDSWYGTSNDTSTADTNSLVMPPSNHAAGVNYEETTPVTLVCETFNSYTPGSAIGTYTGWYDGGSGPLVTAGNGVVGSTGLGSAGNIFNWTAHPFNWNAADLQKITFQGDFKTDGTGAFDDDRLSWTINGTSTSSNNQFGVQLDHPNGGIVTYWSNTIGGSKINDVIVPLTAGGATGTQVNTWYRFKAEITKLSPTSARIDVNLVMLDASGNPTGSPFTGSIADTSTLASGHTPAAGYFTAATMYPSYKNYTAAAAPADNTCYQVVTGP